MRLGFLTLPTDERRLYIEQAATRRNVSLVLLEKDFWVCWLLGILFESGFAGSLVFKGGTSLSKVFGVIERFSEDIDLSLSPEFLKLPEAGTSRNQANKWMTKAEAACARAVKTQIAPALEAAAETVLGKRDSGWFEFLTDAKRLLTCSVAESAANVVWRVRRMIAIHPERPGDAAAIHAVHAASFPTDVESRLVDLLRAAGRLPVSLVAEVGGVVVGHVAFSPVTAASGAVGVGLAPVAVAEPHRRRGIAAALVRAGLEACRAAGFGWAVVMGEPAYYSRFGFCPASGFGLSDEYGGGPAFQAIELVPGALPVRAGLVRYAPEFASVE